MGLMVDVTEVEDRREKEGFKCKRCGRCCSNAGHLEIYEEDIKRWITIGRNDLVDMLDEWEGFGSTGFFRNITTMRCPFLRKVRKKDEYYCEIYDIKPIMCRGFPGSRKHAEWCDCPGYDG